MSASARIGSSEASARRQAPAEDALSPRTSAGEALPHGASAEKALPSDRLVGFGVRDITPPSAVRLSGFAARTQASRGVHDRLYARAMALAEPGGEAVVLVVLDLIGVDAEFTARVRQAVLATAGGPKNGAFLTSTTQIAVLATHTHGGPASLPRAFLGPVDQAAIDRAFVGAVEAALQALDDLAPAILTYGTSDVPGVARNRRRADGPVDERLSVLAAWRPGAASPAGALISFALHPVVLGADNLLLTRDYPGFLVDAVQREFPGATALFACGCAGDVNHGHSAESSWSTAPAAARTFAEAAKIGDRLAAAAADLLRSAKPPPPERTDRGAPPGEAVQARSLSARLPLAAAGDPSEMLARFEAEVESARAAGDPARAAVSQELVAWARARGGTRSATSVTSEPVPQRDGSSQAAITVELQAFELGELTLLFLPGEPFVEYGLRLRERTPHRVLPLAYANDAPGYLPTASEVAAGGYEVDVAYMFYGAPAPFTPLVESALMEQALLLAGATEEVDWGPDPSERR